MRFTLAALVIAAAPLRAQSPADARAVLVAAAQEAIKDPTVTALVVSDTAHARAVAATIGADKLSARHPAVTHRASLVKYVIRVDTAYVDVYQVVTSGARDHLEMYRITLQRRAGQWKVTGSQLTATS